MKKLAIAASLVALAAPASAGAHGPHHRAPAGTGKAVATCKAERASIGKDAFKAKYGKHALRKCVRTQVKSARQACTTERAADKAAFRTKYGKGAKHRNAFRRCVKAQLAA
jgi:hypothetical protein